MGYSKIIMISPKASIGVISDKGISICYLDLKASIRFLIANFISLGSIPGKTYPPPVFSSPYFSNFSSSITFKSDFFF
jgi:hypothetical protein